MKNTTTKIKKQPIIVGLDIGTTKVVAIAGRKNEHGKIQVIGMGMADSAGVDHGVVLNIEECTQSVNNALTNLKSNHPDLHIEDVYVGIAGRHIKSMQKTGKRIRTNSDEVITKEDIQQLIEDQRQLFVPEGDQIIDIIPQEFTVDNEKRNVNPVGMFGVEVGANFHIVTGDKHSIRNIKRCVDNLDLNTLDLVLQPLASAAAILSEEDLEAGVAVIDIGGGTTDLAVFHNGTLKHTAVIPYAGTNITEDIRKGLQVLKAQAENMKVRFGTALAVEASADAYITIPGLRGLPKKEISVKNLASIIQARMEEIIKFAHNEIKSLDINHELFGGIILTGGGSELKNITQLTEFITGYNARIGYPVQHVSGSDIEQLENPRFSTCVGLILRGYSDYESGKLENDNNYLYSEKEAEEAAAVEMELNALAEVEETPVQDSLTPELETVKNDDGFELEEEIATEEEGSKVINKVFETMRGIKDSFLRIFEDMDEEDQIMK